MPTESLNRDYAEIARYREALPRLEKSLDLLRKMIDFQLSLLDEIRNSAGSTGTGRQISSKDAEEQLCSGHPLLERASVPVSTSLFLISLKKLRADPTEKSLREVLDRLLASERMTPENIDHSIDELKSDFESGIQRLAEATLTNADILRFLLHSVLSPFFIYHSSPHRDIVSSGLWQHGCCPMCGTEPAIARLSGEDGRRILFCSLCHTEWAFDRLRCPFCEHGGPSRVRYFTACGDEIHRAECCDFCRRYLKTVDERLAGRRTSPLVEDVITVHLDLMAGEHGYR